MSTNDAGSDGNGEGADGDEFADDERDRLEDALATISDLTYPHPYRDEDVQVYDGAAVETTLEQRPDAAGVRRMARIPLAVTRQVYSGLANNHEVGTEIRDALEDNGFEAPEGEATDGVIASGDRVAVEVELGDGDRHRKDEALDLAERAEVRLYGPGGKTDADADSTDEPDTNTDTDEEEG